MTSISTFAALVEKGLLAIGDGYRAKNDELGVGGPVFLRSAYLQESGWSLDEPECFASRPLEEFGPKVAQVGDTVITTKGNSLGRLGFVADIVAGAVYSPHLSYWRSLDHKRIEPRWLYYWAFSDRCRLQVRSMAHSTDMAPYLSLRDQLRIEIALPPLAEQRAIAEVLGALDDKIEANRRMNATLETLARALYDSTIVGEFVEATLGDICEIFDGPHATPRTVDKGPIFLGISNLSNGQLDLSDTRHVTEDDFTRWTRRVTPSPSDVLFSYETRLGQAAWLPAGIRCCLGRRMGILRAHPSKVPPIILFHAYVSSAFQETIREKTVPGSTVERIPLVEMPSFTIRIPSVERCKVLSPVLLAMRERICLNAAMTQTLAHLRDLLLPKLLSGALRVRDAERMIGDAA